MAGERRINWGADATDARYRTEDTGDGANFVVAEDLDGGTVLLEYDDSASEWVSRGPINMDGNAISNVSDLDVSTVSTEQMDINDFSAVLEKTTDQSLSANTTTTVDWDNQNLDADIYSYDTSTDVLTVSQAGDYAIKCAGVITGMSDQTLARYQITVNGNFTRSISVETSGSTARWGGSVLIKDLSANDTITIDVRSGSDSTLNGSSTSTYCMITKEA